MGRRSQAHLKTRYIYALVDERGTWHYVGQSVAPHARLYQYRDHPRTPLAHWLASLSAPPEIRILEEVPPGGDNIAIERRWIEQALADGQPLTNTIHVPGTPRGRGWDLPEAGPPGWITRQAEPDARGPWVGRQ